MNLDENSSILKLFRQSIVKGWNYRGQHNERMRDNPKEYKERLRYEYETICARDGFPDYFLIVSDLVTWAKDHGIAVGPGRGSSAGSLVAYLLRITEIDPLIYPVLFERFLDPTRTDLPDIDIDFDDTRRSEIFTYAAGKYGEDNVANIGTFTRYKGRNSIDDIARAYRIPEWKTGLIKGKLIERSDGHPRAFNTIEDTYETFSDIAVLINQTPELAYAKRLEGNVRNFGVHAAGMVISSRPINEICATYLKKYDSALPAIPYDKYDAAYLGMLKIDILGLSTMGVIAKVCELAGLSLEDLYSLPLDDPVVYEAFRMGDVLGVFQFEGLTTRRILKKVAPTEFMHLSDINALSRPGASDKDYIENKNKWLKSDIELELKYIHPIMEKHLSWTYGVIVYEEQILMILRDLGGFAPIELNRMRKVMHDKLGSTAFNEYYIKFVDGCKVNGVEAEEAQSIWDSMVGASNYAFNIAHSVSYTHISYWTMYLKQKYPVEFYTGLLLKCEDDVRRTKIIEEALRHGIKVLPPELFQSDVSWSMHKKGNENVILAGFSQIGGIGPRISESIVSWRDFEKQCNARKELDWDELQEVRGIGPGRIKSIRDFCNSDDPFGVGQTHNLLEAVRNGCASGIFGDVPAPTYVSINIPQDRTFVVFTGIVRKRKFYDAAEQLCKRTVGLEYEQALQRLENPDLLKYAVLYCEDEYGEQVAVWIWRKKYPALRNEIDSIKIDRDIIIVEGWSSDFMDISISTNRMWVLEP